jgi:hypothetical protein
VSDTTSLTLNVLAQTENERVDSFEKLSRVMGSMQGMYMSVSLSVTNLSDVEEEEDYACTRDHLPDGDVQREALEKAKDLIRQRLTGYFSPEEGCTQLVDQMFKDIENAGIKLYHQNWGGFGVEPGTGR